MNPRRPRRAGKDERHHRDSEKRRPRKLLDMTSNRNPNNANHGETRERDLSNALQRILENTHQRPLETSPGEVALKRRATGKMGKEAEACCSNSPLRVIALGRVGGDISIERGGKGKDAGTEKEKNGLRRTHCFVHPIPIESTPAEMELEPDSQLKSI